MRQSLIKEVKEKINLLYLENLKEEEIKRLELKNKKMLLEAELRNLDDNK